MASLSSLFSAVEFAHLWTISGVPKRLVRIVPSIAVIAAFTRCCMTLSESVFFALMVLGFPSMPPTRPNGGPAACFNDTHDSPALAFAWSGGPRGRSDLLAPPRRMHIVRLPTPRYESLLTYSVLRSALPESDVRQGFSLDTRAQFAA